MAFPYLNENGHFHIAKEREVDLALTDLKSFRPTMWPSFIATLLLPCLSYLRSVEALLKRLAVVLVEASVSVRN